MDEKKQGYSGTTVTFIFTCLSFLFWSSFVGLLGEGAGLTIGVIQIGLVISYHAASLKLFVIGEEFEGNNFLIFATFFGAVGGLNNIAAVAMPKLGFEYETSVIGIIWILCGLYLLCIVPACLKKPWTVPVLFALAGAGVFLNGLLELKIVGAGTGPIIGWLFFCVGVLGFYMVISGMNGFRGINFSLGKPLIR